MIDNIYAEATWPKPLDFSVSGDIIQVGKITLGAQRCLRNLNVVKYQTKVGNLLFTVTQDKLRISNSIHKFFNGNNYSDFSLASLVHTVKMLEDMTGIPSENFEVKKIEFGLNLLTEMDAQSYLDYFLDYKNVFPINMKAGKIIYGKRYDLSEFRIKIYSKSYEVHKTDRIDISPNILRIEIQFLKSRILTPKFTLKDLTSIQKLADLFFLFKNIVSKIKLKGREDFSKIKNAQLTLYFAGQNPNYWNAEKSYSINTIKSRRRRYSELVKIVNQGNDFNVVDLLEQKFEALTAFSYL